MGRIAVYGALMILFFVGCVQVPMEVAEALARDFPKGRYHRLERDQVTDMSKWIVETESGDFVYIVFNHKARVVRKEKIVFQGMTEMLSSSGGGRE
jgi:hypothetical protein